MSSITSIWDVCSMTIGQVTCFGPTCDNICLNRIVRKVVVVRCCKDVPFSHHSKLAHPFHIPVLMSRWFTETNLTCFWVDFLVPSKPPSDPRPCAGLVFGPRQLPPPIRLFEVGDVVIQEPTREVGCHLVTCWSRWGSSGYDGDEG